MQAPTAHALLLAWERGLDTSPTRRALTLLAAIMPEEQAGQLAQLSIGTRDAALLRLHSVLFGDAVAALAPCPQCHTALDIAFNAADISGTGCAAPHKLCMHGAEIAFRLPNSADLLAVASLDDAPRALLARCVLEAHINGVPVAADALPAPLVESLSQAIAEADPQALIELALHCPVCDHRWNGLFDIASFLWSEVDSQVQRTLRDVHTLARAYGWHENDILSMSARRRQRYLELACS